MQNEIEIEISTVHLAALLRAGHRCVSNGVGVGACFILATGPGASTIAFVLVFQNIVAPILGAPNRQLYLSADVAHSGPGLFTEQMRG